jgi:hypothetical protein
VQTFSQVHAVFLTHLAQLKELEGIDTTTLALRATKERAIGHLCYQAEEDFSHTELALLKDLLALPEKNWQTYKQTYCKDVQKWIESNYRLD